MLLERVPGADAVVFATHCHNDLGMATANALAAVEAGARQIECTINGLGERAGNTSLEEVVMAMRVRNDILPYRTGIDTTKIMQASRLVATVSGFPVQFNKAIVGKNAFAHESGIHQDGMLKNAQTFEIMRPEDIGLNATTLVMGKHSGRAALRAKLGELGYKLGDNQLNDVFVRFKELADRKKEVYDDDLVALMQDTGTNAANDRIQVKRLRVVCGTEAPQTADLVLTIDGVEHSGARHRRRAGRRRLQGGQEARAARGAAGALPGARGDRRAPTPRRRSASGWRRTARSSPASRPTPTPSSPRPAPM